MATIGTTFVDPSDPRHELLCRLDKQISARLHRIPGAPRRRAAWTMMVQRVFGVRRSKNSRVEYLEKRTAKALGLARMASLYFDEHGSSRGDYLTTAALDYVDRRAAVSAPYFDMGRAGLGLVRVTRRRVYAGSSWRPCEASTTYLVGRNEAGTFFAHAVSSSCNSVYDAVQWIWSGNATDIVRRQGDVAVARGRARKTPALPRGHRIDDGFITHATHPAILCPGRGEYLIVGRRAVARASKETRD